MKEYKYIKKFQNLQYLSFKGFQSSRKLDSGLIKIVGEFMNLEQVVYSETGLNSEQFLDLFLNIKQLKNLRKITVKQC